MDLHVFHPPLSKLGWNKSQNFDELNIIYLKFESNFAFLSKFLNKIDLN